MRVLPLTDLPSVSASTVHPTHVFLQWGNNAIWKAIKIPIIIPERDPLSCNFLSNSLELNNRHAHHNYVSCIQGGGGGGGGGKADLTRKVNCSHEDDDVHTTDEAV